MMRSNYLSPYAGEATRSARPLHSDISNVRKDVGMAKMPFVNNPKKIYSFSKPRGDSLSTSDNEKMDCSGINYDDPFETWNAFPEPNAKQRKMDQNFPQQKFGATPLKQSVLSGESQKLGYKLLPTKDVPRRVCFPKWGIRESPHLPPKVKAMKRSLPRVFTVTPEKLQSWPKSISGAKVIFELYGIVDQVTEVPKKRAKKIILRSQQRNNVTCVYYETDRPLSHLARGQWHRCMGLTRSNGEFQCLKISPATQDQLKCLDGMLVLGRKHMAFFLRAVSGACSLF